jgi:hypothetical protein
MSGSGISRRKVAKWLLPTTSHLKTLTPLSWIGSSLTPIPTRSLAALKAAFVPDKDLTYDEMWIATKTLIAHMAKCDWLPNLINKSMDFFQCLNGHPIRNKPQGDQALITYQAEVRQEWHRAFATSKDNQVFDISIINDNRLKEITNEIHLKIISVSSSLNNEIPTDNIFP